MRRSYFIMLLGVLGLALQARGQEPIYVSSFYGNEIFSINQTTGAAAVIYGPVGGFLPEGIRVGPDGKLYVCAPDNNEIIRMNTDGTSVEMVYSKGDSSGPAGPEGPSFSSTGDLYFNTRGTPETHTGVWKIPAAQLSPLPPGGATPINVVTAGQTGSTFGEGTAFDRNDNLLFVDRSGGKVWRFNTSTSTLVTPAIITGLDTPIGIAVSPSGDIFVANAGADTEKVQHFGPSGNFIETYASNFTDPVNTETNDLPIFLAFDASGNLFVTADASLTSDGVGSVWEVTSPTTKTNLTKTESQTGLAHIAVGVALGPTSAPAQNATLHAAGDSFNLGWPVGCNPKATPTDCIYTFQDTYPASMFPEGAKAIVTPTETTQAQWAQRTPPENPYNQTTIATVKGEGGYGIIFSVDCTYLGSPCVLSPNPNLIYRIDTLWKSGQPNHCNSGSGLLSADPIGSPNWVNTQISCKLISSDPTYGSSGTKHCTAGTKCLSDWANVSGIQGGIESLSPTSVNFGNVGEDGFGVRTVTVTNIGNAPITISSVNVAPVNSDDFFAFGLFCQLRPLAVGQSCKIFVFFFGDEDQFGPQSATLSITDTANGSPHFVSLAATVVEDD